MNEGSLKILVVSSLSFSYMGGEVLDPKISCIIELSPDYVEVDNVGEFSLLEIQGTALYLGGGLSLLLVSRFACLIDLISNWKTTS